MYITLICKKAESQNGNSWYVYNTVRNGKWYNVKFNKDVWLPQVYKIGDTSIYRAFICLNSIEEFDVKDEGNRKVVYINNHSPIPDDQIDKLRYEELCKIEAYRKKKEAEKWDFLRGDEDVDIPF